MSASAPASTRDVVLSLLLERGEDDAGSLADAVGISVQAMRRHLRSLAETGLIEASSSSGGPGRPSNRWCLTDQGRDRFPDGSGIRQTRLLCNWASVPCWCSSAGTPVILKVNANSLKTRAVYLACLMAVLTVEWWWMPVCPPTCSPTSLETGSADRL